jgi:hypothetical protein
MLPPWERAIFTMFFSVRAAGLRSGAALNRRQTAEFVTVTSRRCDAANSQIKRGKAHHVSKYG